MTRRRLISATNLIAAMVILCLSDVATAQQNPDADVIKVEAIDHGNRGWFFSVTVLHPDTGWDDYCNGWDVVTDKGEVLKNRPSDEFTRFLLHPHESEQPFTRSQSRLQIPDDVETLTVRAHDILHGFGGKEVVIDLGRDQGPNYEISRP